MMSVKVFVIVLAAVAALAGAAAVMHRHPGASLVKGLRAGLHGEHQ
jgi:hypothetical protein